MSQIEVLATALHTVLGAEPPDELDLSSGPPFASVSEPVLIAATVARRRLSSPRRRKAALLGGRER